jgi:hypothetical protein
MPEFLVIPNKYEETRLFKDYNMNKEQIKDDVSNIRKWIISQPHLPEFPESKNGKFQ